MQNNPNARVFTVWLLVDIIGRPAYVTLKDEDPPQEVLPQVQGGYRRVVLSVHTTVESASAHAFDMVKQFGTKYQGNGPLHNPVVWTEDGTFWVPVDEGARLQLALVNNTLAWAPRDKGTVPAQTPNWVPISTAVRDMILKANAPSSEHQAKLDARETRVRKAKAEGKVKAAEFAEADKIKPVPKSTGIMTVAEWRSTRAARRKKPVRNV